ncbi:hypothetical protein GOP47_0028586, partial [Adiantum capillus-veneris]
EDLPLLAGVEDGLERVCRAEVGGVGGDGFSDSVAECIVCKGGQGSDGGAGVNHGATLACAGVDLEEGRAEGKTEATDADALQGDVVVGLQGRVGVADERSEDLRKGASAAAFVELRGEGEGAGAQAQHSGGSHKASAIACGAAAKGHVWQTVAGAQRESVGDERAGSCGAIVVSNLERARFQGVTGVAGNGEAGREWGNVGAKRGIAGDVAVCGGGCRVKDGLVELLEAGLAGLALDPREVAASVNDHEEVAGMAAADSEPRKVAARVCKLKAGGGRHLEI